MLYTYTYPGNPQSDRRQRFERIYIQEDFLDQTHTELMSRLDSPRHTLAITTELDAPLDVVWEEAAGSVGVFFSHQPGYRFLVHLNMLGSQEGGRFVVIREDDQTRLDRMGEVLVHLDRSQLTVSDIDVADSSVAGSFPTLFTIRVTANPDNPASTLLYLSHTVLGVARPFALNMLVDQINSICEQIKHRLGSSSD